MTFKRKRTERKTCYWCSQKIDNRKPAMRGERSFHEVCRRERNKCGIGRSRYHKYLPINNNDLLEILNRTLKLPSKNCLICQIRRTHSGNNPCVNLSGQTME